jgi:hypothetical protein
MLMILHDAACILDRFDLALGYARRATLILDEHLNAGASDEHIRLRTNAALAETLALNDLGLRQEALAVAERAKALPGYRVEPESWLRSFLEQRLRSLERTRRASIYDAEHTAEQARELVADDPILIAGVEARLAAVYLAQPSPRSVRRAQALVERLLPFAQRDGGGPPLRRVLALRTAARYFDQIGDCPTQADLLRRCMEIADAAGLAYQRTKAALRVSSSDLLVLACICGRHLRRLAGLPGATDRVDVAWRHPDQQAGGRPQRRRPAGGLRPRHRQRPIPHLADRPQQRLVGLGRPGRDPGG